MEEYLRGTLTGPDKEMVTLHIKQCELCSDALEGLKGSFRKGELPAALEEINLKIREKYGPAHPTNNNRTRKLNTRPLLWVAAASMILLFGLLFMLDNILTRQNSGSARHKIEVMEKAVPPKPFIARPEKRPTDLSKDRADEHVFDRSGEESSSPREKNKPVMEEKVSAVESSIRNDDDRAEKKSFEDYLGMEEKTIIPSDEQERYPDIASTLPVEYYLAQVIVNQRQTMSYAQKKESLMNSRKEFTVSQKPASQTPALRVHEQIPATEKLQQENESVKRHFFDPVESMPEFPGGYENLQAYLSANLKYPEKARKDGIQGRVLLSFIIDESGKPVDVILVRGIGGGCDEEAIRVIQSMPLWKPATQNGLPVRVRFTLPVLFNMI